MPIGDWITSKVGVALLGLFTVLVSLGLTALVCLTNTTGTAQGGLTLLPLGLTFAVGTGLMLWSIVPEEIE